MSTATVAPISENDFSAQALFGEDSFTITMTGKADLTVSAKLDGFVDAVHSEAQRLQPGTVRVDLRQLEFMNSSCLRSLVRWIGHIQHLESREQYRLTLVSSPSLFWQRRSLLALTLLASELVSLET
jgi:hypothetical protein